MGTDKRARQKANRQAKTKRETKAEGRADLKSRAVLVLLVALVVGGILYMFSRGGDDGVATSQAGEAVTTTPAVVATTAPPVATSDSCPAEDGSEPQSISFEAAPPMCIDPSKTYTAEMATNQGPITIELDASKAPQTVNNFVVLARYHFYDGATFHRVIADFMIQGGDPVGQPRGTGNPGYQFNDELPVAGDYEIGSIAMANSGPNTQGGQFFIVTGDAGVGLPPLYSLFGQVTDGLDNVLAIGGTATDESDVPLDEVIIESVTITES